MALIAARQDTLLHELKDMADDGFEKAKEDYFKALAAWGACSRRIFARH